SGGGDGTVPARVQAGEGAHSRRPSPRPRRPLPPLPAGEGWGGGQSVASEPAPIPAFPRLRWKGRTVVTPRPARDTRSLPRKRGRVGVGAVRRFESIRWTHRVPLDPARSGFTTAPADCVHLCTGRACDGPGRVGTSSGIGV